MRTATNDVITPGFKYTADRLKEVLLSVSRIIATTPIVFETCSEGVPSLSNCLTYVSRVDRFCSNLVPRLFHRAATAPAERAWEWGWFTFSFVFSPLPTCFPTLFFAESRAGVPVPHDLGNVAFHVGPGHAHTRHLWPVQITQSVNADRTALDFIGTNSSFALVSCRTDQLWSRVLLFTLKYSVGSFVCLWFVVFHQSRFWRRITCTFAPWNRQSVNTVGRRLMCTLAPCR